MMDSMNNDGFNEVLLFLLLVGQQHVPYLYTTLKLPVLATYATSTMCTVHASTVNSQQSTVHVVMIHD